MSPLAILKDEVMVRTMRSHPTPRTGKATGLFALLILFFAASSLPRAGAATLVFDWGGDYVSASTPFAVSPVDPETTPGMIDYRYSSTVPIGTAGGSLYGAFLIEEAGASPTFTTFGYTPSDSIALQTGAGTNQRTMRGIYYFTRDDFLVPDSAPITFDEASSFSFKITSSIGSSSSPNMRQSGVLVHAQVDGVWGWYVSSLANRGQGQLTDPPVTINSLGTVNWSPYSFSADAPLAAVPTGGATILGSKFEDIDAIGLYFNYRRTGEAMSFYVNRLSLTAEAIPEPSVALLTGTGLLLLGAGWSRRRRSS